VNKLFHFSVFAMVRLKRQQYMLVDSDYTYFFILYSSRKYPYSPHRRDWNFLGVGGVLEEAKCHTFLQEMCEMYKFM